MEIHRNEVDLFLWQRPLRKKYPKLPRLEDNLSKDDDYTFLQRWSYFSPGDGFMTFLHGHLQEAWRDMAFHRGHLQEAWRDGAKYIAIDDPWWRQDSWRNLWVEHDNYGGRCQSFPGQRTLKCIPRDVRPRGRHIELSTGWNISLDFGLFTFGNVMEEMHRNCFQILASGLGPGRTTPFMSGSASEKQQGKEKDVKETIKQKGTKESPRRHRSPSLVQGL